MAAHEAARTTSGLGGAPGGAGAGPGMRTSNSAHQYDETETPVTESSSTLGRAVLCLPVAGEANGEAPLESEAHEEERGPPAWRGASSFVMLLRRADVRIEDTSHAGPSGPRNCGADCIDGLAGPPPPKLLLLDSAALVAIAAVFGGGGRGGRSGAAPLRVVSGSDTGSAEPALSGGSGGDGRVDGGGGGGGDLSDTEGEPEPGDTDRETSGAAATAVEAKMRRQR